MEKERAIVSLFEIFHLSQKYMLENSAKKESRLTKTQFYIIMVIHHRKNMSMSQVASAISSSKEQTTRAVAPLVEAGLLTRYHDEKNRRVVHVELTKKGVEVIEMIRENLVQNMEKRLVLLSDEERKRFDEAAGTMLELLLKIDGPVEEE